MNTYSVLRTIESRAYEMKRTISTARLFGNYLGKDVLAELEGLANTCIEANAVAIADQEWSIAHSLENLFGEINDLIEELKKNDRYVSRPQPRGYDRSGKAFY
jgi:hypothetical protein